MELQWDTLLINSNKTGNNLNHKLPRVYYVTRRIADDLIIIQKTINDINQQVPQLKELGQDFDYKYRLFEQDSKKRLDVIQKTMAKYQNQPASN